ncbi:hypothetical protein SAMN05878503_1276 [Cereibacter ovatus]|uniref:Uncharacterized protein n=1 Tax=Cereibacter ovatus TaxID=439529 RepID=A0A285D596_9RHOB|nr:hypothetical protein [Cereibacter ovatus]SNX74845.1 hypothetical protein SAMN05878503_1276 [Cereibacter ovatus]
MAIIHGKDGVVKIGTADFAHVQSWNLDVTADVAEAYSMGEEWKDAGVGVKGWSGSLECYFDPADTTQGGLDVGDVVALNLYPGGDATGARYFSGNAVVSGVPLSGAKDGWVSVTFNFTGKGALASATAL